MKDTVSDPISFLELRRRWHENRQRTPWNLWVRRGDGQEERGQISELALVNQHGQPELQIKTCQHQVRRLHGSWTASATTCFQFGTDFSVLATEDRSYVLQRGDDLEGERASEDGLIGCIYVGAPNVALPLAALANFINQPVGPVVPQPA